jgi:organic hydroperoxide reductase OsmC/OhrA
MATHRYAAVTHWEGSTGLGYEDYGRGHGVTVPPAEASLTMSADPAFRGDPTRVNPEQLLLAAASSCQLLAFLAVAARARVEVVAYVDEASAEMPEDDLPVRLTRIDLRPHITVRGDVAPDRIGHLVEVAHRECFIANSLRTEIVVIPTIVVREL